MRRLLPFLLLSFLITACATAQGNQSSTRENPCEDPVYEELRTTPPDSLSNRELTRLEQLEASCTQYREGERAEEMVRDTTSSTLLWGVLLTAGSLLAVFLIL